MHPDIRVPQEQALDGAYRMALKAIIDSQTEPVSSQLLKEAEAALEDIES